MTRDVAVERVGPGNRARATPRSLPPVADAALARGTVLIVEPDQRVRDLQAFFLEEAGFGVAFHANGEAALEAVATTHPVVVVTEILVPGLDGLSLCRRLQADRRTRHIPVIVFSMLAASSRATDAGACAFLRKPLVEASFIEAIGRALATPHQPTEHQWDSM